MIEMDLKILQDSFLNLIKSADHQNLAKFIFWLDLKISEYKVNGFIAQDPDSRGDNKNPWLEHAARQLFNDKRVSPINGHSKSVKKSSQKQLLPKPMLDAAERNPEIWNFLPDENMFNTKKIALPLSKANNNFIDQTTSIASQPQACTPPRVSDHQRAQFLSFSDMKYNRSRDNHAFPIDRFLSPDTNAMDLQARHLSVVTAAKLNERLEPLDFSGWSGCNGEAQTNISPNSGNAKNENALTGIEKVNCPYCPKSFMYRSSYRRHVKIHQGIFSHTCFICGRKFMRKEHFDRHKCDRKPNKPNRASSVNDEDFKVALSETYSVRYQNFPTTVSEMESENFYSPFSTAENFLSRRKSLTPRKLQKSTLKSSNGAMNYELNEGINQQNVNEYNDDLINQTNKEVAADQELGKKDNNYLLPEMVTSENAEPQDDWSVKKEPVMSTNKFLSTRDINKNHYKSACESSKYIDSNSKSKIDNRISSASQSHYHQSSSKSNFVETGNESHNMDIKTNLVSVKSEPEDRAESPIEIPRCDDESTDNFENEYKYTTTADIKYSPEMMEFPKLGFSMDSDSDGQGDLKIDEEMIEYCDINALMCRVNETA